MADTAPSIKVVKSFDYKGGLRNFSNRYHFLGGTPADAAHWITLMDAVVTAEKAIFNDAVEIVQCVGYNAGSDVPVAEKVYTTVGTLTLESGAGAVPGDCTALLRYSTAERTSKNHPIYLFNYYHGVFLHAPASDSDTLSTNQKTAIATYATHWITGFSDGTNTYTRSGPRSQAATGSIVEEFITHRDFPYQSSV